MSGLPERLRKALEAYESDPINAFDRPQSREALARLLENVRQVADELAAERPEPAGWEAVEQAVEKTLGGPEPGLIAADSDELATAILAAIKPLWPAPPPRAASAPPS